MRRPPKLNTGGSLTALPPLPTDTDSVMSNVIDMPTSMSVLAERIKAAYGRIEDGKKEWIDGTLELAAALDEARARFPSDTDFGVWLVQNELDWLGKDDRAALLGMANELDLTRIVLEETKRTCLRARTPTGTASATTSRFHAGAR
jgi:hypothetical protein